MTKDQALRVIELGKRGLSRAMIGIEIKREFKMDRAPNNNTIREVLVSAGFDGGRDDQQEHMELQKWSDPYELRARWAARLPAMKAKLRANIGGI